jgi:hypothetical protein
MYFNIVSFTHVRNPIFGWHAFSVGISMLCGRQASQPADYEKPEWRMGMDANHPKSLFPQIILDPLLLRPYIISVFGARRKSSTGG